MFARKLKVEIANGDRRPCPLDWMDHFFMRHFTGISALEQTLPVADGRLEAGFDVGLDLLRGEFEKWLHGRKMIDPGERVEITEM